MADRIYHPVDQKFDQSALLLKVGIDQPGPDARAEIVDGDGKSADLFMAFGLSGELDLLFRQRLISLF